MQLSIKPMSRPYIIWPAALASSGQEAFLVYGLEPCPILRNSSIAASCDAIALRDEGSELRLNCCDPHCEDFEQSSSHRTCSRSSGRSSRVLTPSKLQTATSIYRAPLRRSRSVPRNSRDGLMIRANPHLFCGGFTSKKALPCKPTLPAKSGNAIVWAESQPEWPDGRRPRSIVIELSHGLLDRIKV